MAKSTTIFSHDTNASSFSRSLARLMKIQPVIYGQQQLSRKHGQARPSQKIVRN